LQAAALKSVGLEEQSGKAEMGWTRTRFAPDTGFRFDPVFGPIKADGHIDTWTFTKAPSQTPEHEGAYIDIVLEQPGYERELVPLLDQFVEAVAAVLRRFATRFPDGLQHLSALAPTPHSGAEFASTIRLPDED
jgi:hypothetical protein